MPLALISGATGGIGSAVALERARAGWALGLIGRDERSLSLLKEQVAAAGAADAFVLGTNLVASDVQFQLERFAAEVAPIHLVVHAAGESKHGRFHELTDDDWRDSFNVKFLGAVRLVRAVRTYLSPGASIVFIVGQGGVQPTAEYSLSAVNAALAHLSKSLALDLATDGFRVNAINPGPTTTARLERRLIRRAEAEGKPIGVLYEELKSSLPLRRLVHPDDVAAAVAYLSSATCVTGEILSVSSGRSAFYL